MDAAGLLRAFNLHMHKVVHLQDTGGAAIRFWRKHGMEEPPAARKIWLAHVDRCAGTGSPADCDSALASALREIGAHHA